MNNPYLKSFIAISACFFLVSFMPPQQTRKGVVDIIDLRKPPKVKPAPVVYNPYDVVVRRTSDFYRISYYSTELPPYSDHGASIGSTDDFNKAAYEWLNDSTVSIKLYSDTSTKSMKIKIWGKADRSGMETE